MKNDNFFIVVALCVSFSSTNVFCAEKPEKNYLQVLQESRYNPEHIKCLRDEYSKKNPEMIKPLNAHLEKYYRKEYRKAIKNIPSQQEKFNLLDRMECCLSYNAGAYIDGERSKCMAWTKDGSDFGSAGLRMDALQEVKKEVKL